MIARYHDDRKEPVIPTRDDMDRAMKGRVGIVLDDPVDHILRVAVQRRGPPLRLDAPALGLGEPEENEAAAVVREGERRLRENSLGIIVVPEVEPVLDLEIKALPWVCLLYTSPSPRDRTRSRMPSSA